MNNYYYSKDGLTIAAILDSRRPLANGEYPVKIRVTYQRKQTYYPTGKSMSEDAWESLNISRRSDIVAARKDIENSFSLVKASAQELIETGIFTIDMLNTRMSRGQSMSLKMAIESKINQLREDAKIGSADVYASLFRSLKIFAPKDVRYEDVSPMWLKRFEESMRKSGKSQTTIAMNMRSLRSIINDAKRAGLIKDALYPFGRGKYEIQEGEGRKLALTLEQIGQVARYDDGTDTSAKYRDYWLFLYLCNGINVADFVKLKYDNIVNGEIYFVRQKTEHRTRTRKEICVPISSPMQEIIDRWGNPPEKGNYIFPILKGDESELERNNKTKYFTRSINRRMQSISKELGISHISTYTARHSFATVLKRSGTSIAYISESLGHQNIKTTENYLASFEREERAKNAELLTRF